MGAIMQSIAERVRRFIIDDLGWDGAADELTDDLPLIHAGALDSIGILTLVQFLESNYGIIIDDDEIVSVHLGSLASIERLVQSKKSSQSPHSPEFSRL
jgi:acyl carrier protein